MTETILFEISNFAHWNLFVILCLGFGASIFAMRYALCAMRYASYNQRLRRL
jgi:hypothetical protein